MTYFRFNHTTTAWIWLLRRGGTPRYRSIDFNLSNPSEDNLLNLAVRHPDEPQGSFPKRDVAPSLESRDPFSCSHLSPRHFFKAFQRRLAPPGQTFCLGFLPCRFVSFCRRQFASLPGYFLQSS